MILVIGDYIIDRYIYGSVKRISPESPIPVFEEISSEDKDGGAGNVVANLRALGNEVLFITNMDTPPLKTRYVVNNHILFRSDNESYNPPDEINLIIPDNIHYAILSDYNKGYLKESNKIIEVMIENGVAVIVDPKKHISNYKNAHIIKFNEKEFYEYTEAQSFSDCESIRKKYGISTIIITMGGNGVFVSDLVDGDYTVKTKNHPVSDVTGAGDVFIASLTHFLNKKNTIKESIKKANTLASISVTKFGTTVLSEDDIKKSKVIFTNGCFDIIHKGHIDYLKYSKSLGYKLVVGLNSDESVRKLKGKNRPINNQEDRKSVLESLDCVDEVIIFDEETPYNLIKLVKPDIITKGGDYTTDTVVGNDLAEVIIVPFTEGYSTTNIAKKMKVKK
jgi:D-beta-D-heptose 7-phosphate kinase/D-beta-D-heptose 1-phosphate adenosyltransferase